MNNINYIQVEKKSMRLLWLISLGTLENRGIPIIIDSYSRINGMHGLCRTKLALKTRRLNIKDSDLRSFSLQNPALKNVWHNISNGTLFI